jgi:hypothetical protein
MTDPKLDSIFCSLEASAFDLNKASEAANKALRDAEKRLVALEIGMEAWYPQPLETTDWNGRLGPDDNNAEVASLLGFCRMDGKWCLAVKRTRFVHGFFEGDTNCPYTNPIPESPPAPLLKQSRSMRVKAVTALPGFLKYLNDKVSNTSRVFWDVMEKAR